MEKVMRKLCTLSAAMLVAILLAHAPVSAVEEPSIVISITPAADPIEATVGEELQIRFNINVSDGEGNPATLPEAIDIDADLAGASDADSGLTSLAASDVFHLPAGFTGGTRTLITVVGGEVPVRPVTLTTSTSFLTVAPGVQINAGETAAIQVRTKPGELDGAFDFCIAPGRGERGSDPLLFSDFKRVLVVAHVTGAGLPSATILAGVQISVVELVEDKTTGRIVEVDQDDIALSEALNTKAVDADNDGFAEGVTAVLRLEAADPVVVAVNVARTYRLRIRHTDGINTELLGQQDFDVARRERTSVPDVAIVGDDGSFAARFMRRQSRAFAPALQVLRNGVALNAAARATLTLQPEGGNAVPDEETGLFDLEWRVEVNWQRLQRLVPWQPEDTFTIRASMPGAGNYAEVTHLVAFDGVDATVFRTPQSLIDKEYDGDVTEKDHVDALVEALKAAGVRARENPDRLEVPTVASDPDELGPNWDRVRRALKAIKDAVKAYKTAPRIKDGMDCLAGQKEWNIDITIQCPVVDANGNPVTDENGNPKMKDVKLKIVFNPNHTATGDGESAKGSDKGEACTLLIVIGQCGKYVGNKPGNGGKAEAEVKGKGSIGIAVGGDGPGKNDPNVGDDGGNGGDAKVTAGKTKGVPGPGPTGIAIGGNGGDTAGQNAKPGDGGNAEGKGAGGGDGDVVAQGGDSGNGKIPPSGAEFKGGKAKVENEDSIAPDGAKAGKKETGTVKTKGRAGKCTGGTARAEDGDTPDSADGTFKPDNPVTGD